MFSSAEAPELGDLELMAGLPFVSFRAAGCGAKFGEGGGSVQRARLRSGVAPARMVARPGRWAARAGLLYRHRCLRPSGVVGGEELPVEPLAADAPVPAGLAVVHVPGQGEEHGLAADGVGSPHVPLAGGVGSVAVEVDGVGGEVMFGEGDLLGYGVEAAGAAGPARARRYCVARRRGLLPARRVAAPGGRR